MENSFPQEQQPPSHTEPLEGRSTPPSPVGEHSQETSAQEPESSRAAVAQNGHTEEHGPENPATEPPVATVSDSAALPTPAGEQTEESGSLDENHDSGAPSPLSSDSETDANFETGSLEDYAERSKKSRLNSEDEARAADLLKTALLGGRADVTRAVVATPLLPWIVSVQATANAWPEMKPSFRSQFLAGLARTQGEQAARVRLSLARGLFKVDQTASLKLILLTLKLLRNKESGLLEGKGPSLFSNVLIGRGKAWALQLPLQSLKPAEADLLVFAALHGAFHAPQAPIAQLSILKWAATAERLTRLPEALEALILKGISRWSGKWQNALRKEVSPLPESWSEGLKSSSRPPVAHSEEENDPDTVTDESKTDREEESPTRARHHAGKKSNGGTESPTSDHDHDEADDEDEDETRDSEEDTEDEDLAPKHKQRPVYVSKTVPTHGSASQQAPASRRGGGSQHFNLQDALRQIDNHVAGLRAELSAAQKQLRHREDDPRKNRRNDKQGPVGVPGDLSTEELLRLNQQLESRNEELKARIDELTIDSEERAASGGLTTDAPAPDPATQLRTLLAFKLKDDYEDFLALQQEARDLVVQQHYRTVLQHVFEVLLSEGIHLSASEAQPRT